VIGPEPTMAAQNWLPPSGRSPMQTDRGTVSDPDWQIDNRYPVYILVDTLEETHE